MPDKDIYMVLASFQVTEDDQLLAKVLLTLIPLLSKSAHRTCVRRKLPCTAACCYALRLCSFQVHFM